MTDTRCVWITREQRDRLAWRNDPIADLYDAAPADATEAVAKVVARGGIQWKNNSEFTKDFYRQHARAVLAALGVPA